MKTPSPIKSIFASLGLAVAVVLALPATGCVATYGHGGYGLEVDVPPPAVRAEVAYASPGPGYIWIDGFWDWGAHDYFWVPGRWDRPPRLGAVWVGPRYDHRGRHHYYQRGHWR
jgi:hypothetical protein